MDFEERTGAEELRENARTDAAETPAVSVEAEATLKAFVKTDLLDFMEHYPQFSAEDLEALEHNAQFRRFCGTRYGREPLAVLYGDYLFVVEGAGKAAEDRAASRSARSTGGGTAGGATLTPAQRKLLDAWNEANPDMQMTAKEYLNM